MKVPFLRLIFAFALQFLGYQVRLQAVTLSDVFQEYNQSQDWSAKGVGEKVRSFLGDSPPPSEVLTGKLILLNYLMGYGGAASENEALVLASSIVQQNPNTWQAAMAAVCYAALLNFDEDVQALTAAQNALTLVNAVDFSSLSDSSWIQFRDGVGSSAGEPKDGALAVLAAVYIRLGLTQDAASTISQIVDPEIKAKMTEALNAPPE